MKTDYKKMERNMAERLKNAYRKILRILLAYILIPIGFVFEFIITFPYIIMVSIDERRRNAPRRNPAGDRSSAGQSK